MKDIELKLLKLLLKKDFYTLHGESISNKILSVEVKALHKVITKLHKLSDKDVDINTIYDMYEASATVTTAKLTLVKVIIERVKELPEIAPDTALEILEKISEKEAARLIADKALSIMQRNEDAGTLTELKEFVANIDIKQSVDDTDVPYTTNVLEVIADKTNKGAFEFSNGLEFISTDVGKLSRGRLVIIFAPTNAGKSSFVAQASGGFISNGHKVLYFANEEPADHIMLNQVRALEKRTDTEIIANPTTPTWDSLRHNFVLIPAHGKSMPELIKYVTKYKPDIIIFDQLDNVQGSNIRDKLHETLERTYQQVRSLASTADALVIAISQASDDATGKLVLRSQMLANSKVGKAAAADLIIGIGMKNVEDEVRGITLCKNKITGLHKTFHCILNHRVARYEL